MVGNVMHENFKQTHQRKNDEDCRIIRTLPVRFHLLIIVVCFTCIIEAASVFVNEEENEHQSTNSTPTETACNSTICQNAAAQVKSWMNEREEPCNNFFHFTCGGWLKKSKRSQRHYSRIDRQRWKLNSISRGLLTSNVTTSDPNINRLIAKMRRYYENCVNFDYTKSHGDQVNHLLSQVPLPYINTTGWESMELEVFLAKLDLLEVYIFFKPDFPYSSNNLSLHTLRIDQPPTKIRKRKLKRFVEVFRLMRKAVISDVLRTVYESFNITNVFIDADAIVNLELLITDATTDRDSSKCCIDEWIMSISEFNSSMSNFDWGKYLNYMMSHESPIPNTTLRSLPDDYMMRVGELRYFGELDKILRSNDIKRTVGMFATFRILEKFRHNLPNPYNDLFNAFSGALINFGVVEQWPYCYEHIRDKRFVDVLMRIYSQEYFDQEAKVRAEQMFLRMKNFLLKRLENDTWMDKVLIEFLARKIQKMAALIGFPDRIYDANYLVKWYDWVVLSNRGYLVDEIENTKGYRIIKYLRLWYPTAKNRVYTTMLSLKAYSSLGRNMIVIPMGNFQSPLHLPGFPQYLLYAEIGHIMAHEIGHFFTETSFQYDEKGEIPTQLANETLESFKNASECIIDKYSKFTAKFDDLDITLNGYQYRHEILADHVGFTVSFEAYKQWVKENGKVESKLPALDYTPEQLFFIGAAQPFCGVDMREEWSKAATHPPGRVRINGGVTKNQNFQEAFHCQPGHKLYATEKCGMW